MRSFQYMQQCSEANDSQRCLYPPPHTWSLNNWQAQRKATKDHHILMCHALQQHRTRLGKETAEHHYINESNMINRLVLGMESKQWLAEQGLEGELRRHLTAYQLEKIAFLERRNANFLDADMPFTERKEQLTTLVVPCIELARDVHWGSPDAEA
ncbi:hypothetical protein [Aeromonas caviae]|uniref:hypothetical protein n=1 Tax=Aeromonas caviae TaxID=648 RepID=UPI0029DB70E1|nr:hypothetical protein [Aeromonas caviae]MDX7704900.1 hypothetical protein [Aeromonas caviae]MDX7796854.1 hypothetical protein [Aeromonas caviae]